MEHVGGECKDDAEDNRRELRGREGLGEERKIERCREILRRLNVSLPLGRSCFVCRNFLGRIAKIQVFSILVRFDSQVDGLAASGDDI